MTEYYSIQSFNDTIEHFGIKGMKWGHRKSKEFYTKKYIGKGYHPRHAREMAQKRMVLNRRLKTGAKIAGGVALAGLAAYGAYKGYGALKGNWDRATAERLATEHRKNWERLKSKQWDKSIDKYNSSKSNLASTGKSVSDGIRNRHEYAAKEMKKAFGNIYSNDSSRDARLNKQFDEIDGLLKDLGVGRTRGANGRRIKDVTNSLR